ncbi:MAG: bifunctional phosphoribosyl-AMP cyclohydrolase/phosphoribosyl-ATP diphosphatase HisIE [Bacteroidales bacterium]|nr:bifunctional phosphoribosyl-AMP cyclohydrolase/phosphoribosyl-ATP diphosphatase HisIE [Bacteroidales bacterium]
MKLDFTKLNGLIPAVIQDSASKTILMVGFMNEEAYKKTKKTGKVCFYSRSKKRLWTKGEESGNFLFVEKIIPDCDNDTLLIKAKPAGPVCHTGTDTCFNEENIGELHFLEYLEELLYDRKKKMPEDSYTTTLFKEGVNKIAKKLGEEAVELIIEAKDKNDDLFLNEAADLFYHLEVMLVNRDVSIKDVFRVLEKRHRNYVRRN